MQYRGKNIKEENSSISISIIIGQNIDFVEKYIDRVDEIEDLIEKEIMYRELGSIVVSCVEALSKSVLSDINEKCSDNKCCKVCSYRKTKKSIASLKIINILKHLNNTRMLWFSPDSIDSIKRIIDLRNYIHLCKNMEQAKQKVAFDRKFVEEALDLYYKILDQLECTDWYFKTDKACLNKMDENNYQETKEINEKYLIDYYESKLMILLDKLIYGEKLSSEEEWTLASPDNEIIGKIDINKVAKYVAVSLYSKGVWIKIGNEYIMDKNWYNRVLGKYTHKYKLDEKINEKMAEMKKRRVISLQ